MAGSKENYYLDLESERVNVLPTPTTNRRSAFKRLHILQLKISKRGYNCYLTISDAHSQHVHKFLMKSNFDIYEINNFLNSLNREFQLCLKRKMFMSSVKPRSDNY